MNNSKPARWRFELPFALLVVALVGLGARLVWLQYGRDAGRLSARGQYQQQRVIVQPARPGSIFARSRGGGVMLAMSEQVPSCYADPELIGPEKLADVAGQVAAAAGASAPELLSKLTARHPVCLFRGLSEAQALAVGRLALAGVEIANEQFRRRANAPVESVLVCYADPEALGEENFESAASRLAAAAGGQADEILALLKDPPGRRFRWLLPDISEDQQRAIESLRLKGVGISYQWRRSYPNGPLAGQVLGYRRPDGVAGEGLELYADEYLLPRDGVKVIRTDATRRGSYAQTQEYTPPQDGKCVLLTLDAVVQGYLEQALSEAHEKWNARAVMGVVMDPNTGEILAMGSMPNFDPNYYRGAYADERKNRAITDPYEPGSAFKPYVAVGAIGLGRATLNSSFFCAYGTYAAPRGGTIRDFPGEHFGLITLLDIIVHSSNIGMARLGETLGNETLYQIAHAFGFGQRTGVDLPGESPGMLPPVRDSRGRGVWTSYDTLRLPFGQGPVSVTALQLANGFSAIANGGVLMRPHVIDKVLDVDGSVVCQSRPARIRRVLPTSVARAFVEQALVGVVERGTGKSARLDRWSVFGKTGTGQIGGPHGYEDRAYTGTFVAGAPARQPKVVCVISVYRPDYSRGHAGGVVAAPFVRDVLGKTLAYLDVPPDKAEAVALADAASGGRAMTAD